MESPRLVSQDRVEALIELLDREDLVGISEAWQQNIKDLLHTCVQLRLDALEHDRAEELFRKEAMELRDVAVWSIAKLRGVINGIERKGRNRKTQTDPRVPVWKCGCNGGEPDSCKDGVHTAIIPGKAQGVQDEDPGHYYDFVPPPRLR